MHKAIEKLIENSPLAVIALGAVLFVAGAAGGWPLPKFEVRETEWRIAIAVLGIALGGVGALLLLRTGTGPTTVNPKKLGITITSPSQRERVARPNVSGTYKKQPPSGWVVEVYELSVRQHDYKPRRRVVFNDDGTWNAHDVFVGGKTDEEKILCVMAVGKAGQALRTYYDKIGDIFETKDRPPITELTPDTVECHRVRVLKQ